MDYSCSPPWDVHRDLFAAPLQRFDPSAAPSVKNMDDGSMELIDPLAIASDILRYVQGIMIYHGIC